MADGKEEVPAEPKRLLDNNVYSPLSTEEMEEADGRPHRSKGWWEKFKKSFLPVMTVVSVVAGVSVGLTLRFNASSRWTEREVMYIQFPGDLFLRMLKAMVIPLMVSSVTAAVGSLDLSLSKKIGSRALLFYATTTILAVIEGIILVSIIHPGRESMRAGAPPANSRPTTTADTLLDLVRNMFPPNLVESCIAQYRTILIPPTPPDNFTGNWTEPDIKEWRISGEYTSGSNVLGLIIFSIVHGIAIGKLGAVGKPLLDFYTSLGESVMLMTNWILWLSPLGVFFLVVAKILEAESFSAMVGQLGLYFLTVLVGLTLHGFIVVPGIYVICTKKLPFGFIANMGQAIITAFATGSSAATLSVSLNCLEEKIKIDTRVTRFVMPIGATVNMDGTALYEAVAVIFISQIRNMSLTLGQLVAVSISATLASIGAAAIPQAGLVTMVMVLDTVGLPAEDVTLIFAVDWLLDRCRTTVNVLGDAIGAGIVDHLSKKELEKMDREAAKAKPN